MPFRAADPLKIPIDPNGNLTSKTEGTDTWAYAWNAENQLTRVEKNGVEQARFATTRSAGESRRSRRRRDDSYTYDGRRHPARGPRGGHAEVRAWPQASMSRLAVDDGTALSYFHADGLGSIVKVTNAAGAVTLTRQYDAWGNLEVGASEPGYAFTGREWDPRPGSTTTELDTTIRRIGRFSSEDPIGEGEWSPFVYADDNPSTLTDPYGLQAISPPIDLTPTDHYHICCKGGRMTYCAGSRQLQDACLDACAQEHERDHVKDFCKAGYGDFCKGKPDGPVPRGGARGIPEDVVKQSECKQNTRSWNCIKKCANSAEKKTLKKDVALAMWDNCGKGPRPPW